MKEYGPLGGSSVEPKKIVVGEFLQCVASLEGGSNEVSFFKAETRSNCPG